MEWFVDRPIFYDQSQRDFKNRTVRDRQLALIGLEVGLTGPAVFAWFRSVRTMYGRLLKKTKSGQAKQTMTERQTWLLRSFSFLDSHLRVQGETRQLGEVSIVIKDILLYYISFILVCTNFTCTITFINPCFALVPDQTALLYRHPS